MIPDGKDCGVAELDATAEHHQALVELAEAFNIATDYWDWQGKHVVVAPETIIRVLAGLGVDADSSLRLACLG